MGSLIVITGVQGAGKSTLQKQLDGLASIRVLQPSTDRNKRLGESTEYDFVQTWPSQGMAWTINVGKSHYGMRESQLDALTNEIVGVTIFDPSNLAIYRDKAKSRKNLEVVLVGLDTIAKHADQASRVGHDTSRMSSEDLFANEIAEIRNYSDIVLSGNEATVCDAFLTVVSLLRSRGGVLIESQLRSLISAGSLLSNADQNQIQPASYDLRLSADKVWCRGQFIALDDLHPTIKIPPHSFVLVEALELAALPRFLTARFDLKVSLFFQGVILSNGPQVDPGYRGSLFCMLFNGSDVAVGLTRRQHFATIEFFSTTLVAPGYSNQYSGKSGFEQFLTSQSTISPGGNIVQRIDDGDALVRKELSDRLEGTDRWLLVASAMVFALLLGLTVFAYTSYTELTKAVTEARNSLVETKSLKAELKDTVEEQKKQIEENKKLIEDQRKQAEESKRARSGNTTLDCGPTTSNCPSAGNKGIAQPRSGGGH